MINSHSIMLNFTSMEPPSHDSYTGYRWVVKAIRMVSCQDHRVMRRQNDDDE